MFRLNCDTRNDILISKSIWIKLPLVDMLLQMCLLFAFSFRLNICTYLKVSAFYKLFTQKWFWVCTICKGQVTWKGSKINVRSQATKYFNYFWVMVFCKINFVGFCIHKKFDQKWTDNFSESFSIEVCYV